MGFSETDSSKCRRHPNQRQVPGVCSSCLREKLTKLNNSTSFNRRSTTNSNYFVSYSSSVSGSTSPPYSTASSSSAVTTRPKSPGNRHRRNGSEAYVSVGMVLNDGLKKSRSVSCAPLSKTKLIGANMDCISNDKIVSAKNKSFVNGGQILEEDNNNNNNNLRKKGGFFKKLIHSTGKKTKGVLAHSKTMKERSHTSSTTVTASSITKNES